MKGPRVQLVPHAPLMWVLFPLLGAYGFAEEAQAQVADYKLFLLFLGLSTLGGGLYSFYKKSWRIRIYAALAVFALGALFFNFREARPLLRPEEMAPKEADLLIEIKQLFAVKPQTFTKSVAKKLQQKETSPYKNAAGIGIIKSGERVGERINFYIRWQPREGNESLPRPEVSQLIHGKGVLAPNPKPIEGEEDAGFAEYLWRAHVPWSLKYGQLVSLERPAWPIFHQAALLHDGAVEILQRRLFDARPEDAGLLPAMVMGERAELTSQQKEQLLRSGTMHLVAVSGMNLMVVAAVLWVVLRATGLPKVALAGEIVALMALYALATGSTPSVWRAWGMLSLGLAVWALKRRVNLWAIVVLAATASLLWEPRAFLNMGWRLSFGVVSGLVLGMGALERWGVFTRLTGFLKGGALTLAGSIVAGLSVAPMTATYWGLAQPLGFLVNALAVTLASGVTVLGTVSWLVCWVPGLSAAFNEIAYWLIAGIDAAVVAYLKLPGAVVETTGAKASGVETWGTLLLLGIFYAAARWGKAAAKPKLC